MKKERIIESLRTTFSVVGGAGLAGYISAMHFIAASISIVLIGATWYSVYRITE